MAEARIQIILSDGRKAGETLKELGKDANRLNKELKDLKPGTEQFVAKSKDLQQVNARLKEVKDQITGTTQASNALKDVFDQYVPFSGQFAEIGRQIGGVKSGVGGLTSGFGLLKGAIAATGIGLLIVLLGSLWSWFSKTERGADFLSKAMAAAGAAVNVLIDRASKLIDALIAFVKGDWSEAANKFGEATRGVTQEIVEETKAAWDLADALDQLEELEGKLILIRSRSRAQISELRKLAKDEDQDLAKRAAAMQEAIRLTQELNKQELQAKEGRILQALQVRNLDELTKKYGVTLEELLAKGENVLTVDNLGLGESTQEDLNKAFQAIADYNEQITASNNEERSLITELAKLKRKTRKEDSQEEAEKLKAEKKALEEEYKAKDNIRKLEGEKRLALIEDEKAREIEALNIATEEKIIALQGTEAQILEQTKLLRDIQGAELAAVEKKWADKKAEEDKKAKEEQAKRDKEAADKELEEFQKLEEAKSQIQRDSYNAAADIQGSFIDLLSQDEASRKKHATAIKALQIGSVTTSLAAEIQAIWEYANKNPSNALFPGAANIIAVVKTIAATARAGAALSRIKGAKFALGGLLQGRRHSEGGIPAVIRSTGEPIEMEGGEFVFSRRATRALGAVNLSRLNDSLTKKMEIGGPVNPFDLNRAAVPSGRASSRGSIDINSGNQELIARIDMLIAAQDRRIDRLKTYVLTSDIESGMKTVTKIKEDADL